MDVNRPNLTVIAGPTASGKTGLAVSLAKQLNGEVVSADSMQIYREPKIGTARPTEKEMQGIPHHLLGFLPLDQGYSVSQYAHDARAAIEDIIRRKKYPILCGGTGLYIDAIVDNLQFPEEKIDTALREKLKQQAQSEGAESLLKELYAVDAETAERLHPNNLGRIIRALEVYKISGITMSEQMRMSRSVPSPYTICYLVLDCHCREFLYDRINRRVDAMMEHGLLDEAKLLLSAPTAPTALQAIGYKELAPYFSKEISLEEAIDNLKRSTRHYAKRQLSWFHRRKEAHFLYIDEYKNTVALTDAALKVIAKEDHENII